MDKTVYEVSTRNLIWDKKRGYGRISLIGIWEFPIFPDEVKVQSSKTGVQKLFVKKTLDKVVCGYQCENMDCILVNNRHQFYNYWKDKILLKI